MFPFLFSLLSAVLLIALYPSINFGFLAWICLVPFFLAIDKTCSRRQAALAGLVTGLLFYSVSLFWLTEVAWIGWIFIFLLETCFFILFGVFAYEGKKIQNLFLRVVWVCSSWTVLEWVRSEMPIFGFGWNLLAYSQADHPWVRQTANTVGAYGLGFVIVWVNATLNEIIFDLRKRPEAGSRVESQRLIHTGVLLILMSGIVSHGIYHSKRLTHHTKILKVAVIQGNIPQSVKWQPMAKDEIIEAHLKLTEEAVKDKPDLIVWPEAAFPGYFNTGLLSQPIKEMAARLGTPLLLGSPHSEDEETAYNSAYLVNQKGIVEARYDKQFLVPFGEYVPLRLIFRWLEPIAYSMGVSNFSAGTKPTVFPFKDASVPFSVLICFEDLFPYLVHQFKAAGAKFLIVITNDAWFGQSAVPYQHLQASIFRAVENGTPIVRAANTGISAFISPKGEVTEQVRSQDGRDIFVSGFKTATISIPESETLFTQFGFLFPYLILGIFLWLLVSLKKRGMIFN